MKTILLLIPILITGLAGLAVFAGVRTRVALRHNRRAPGALLEVSGKNLHVLHSGSEGPSIVILAGLGDFSLSWASFQNRLLGKCLRVTVYDRAGLGWSDPGPQDATIRDAADDLHLMLQVAEIKGPHILVGHSYGGMLARLYAHLHPEDVAGLVLLDSSHEDQFSPEPVREMLRKMAWMMPLMMGGLEWFVKTGLPALNPELIPDTSGTLAFMDAHTQRAYREVLASRPEHLRASSRELRMLEPSNAIMRAACIQSLGDIPVVVVRHGKAQPQMGGAEVSQLLEATFIQLQEELARLSPRGELRIAHESGHAIHLEQPEIVVQAVLDVVARSSKPLMSVEAEVLPAGGG